MISMQNKIEIKKLVVLINFKISKVIKIFDIYSIHYIQYYT